MVASTTVQVRVSNPSRAKWALIKAALSARWSPADAETSQGVEIGHQLAKPVDGAELLQRRTADCVLKRFIGKAVTLQQQVHAQQHRHAHRLPADTCPGWVQRFVVSDQARLRERPFYDFISSVLVLR